MNREMPYLTLPIILVHGIFMRDDSRFAWGRVPLWLSEGGNAVYFANTNACSPVEVNAQILSSAIERVCMRRGVEAAHLICFSRGGVDARYCAGNIEQRGRIASITTLCTPHAGSFVARNGFEVLPDPAVRIVVCAAQRWARILGDSRPDALRVFSELDPLSNSMENQLDRGIYCQSYALESARPCRVSFMRPVDADEVPNDGLVSVRSARWANFRGTFYPTGSFPADVKHEDMVDARRKRVKLGIRRPDGSTHDVGDLRSAWCLMLGDLREAQV